ncbi:MAG: thiamine-phosphate kinase [Candidatus Melainabacteria bacterium GWF2_32_7]|nr:MAG: thiamine-phosphate kinase [Candidatus Melainabacteria bacterium GWF2_32_7]
MKEDLFIELIKKNLPESAHFIGDDTAYVHKKDLILTQDTLIEDVHFRKSTISPYYLGRKAIAVNLSDIAAAGGEPSYALISLSLPENIDENFIEEFYKGVNDICSKYGVLVVGGDLTRAFQITISVCMLGFGNGLIPANRRNAKVGDYVIVTGNFGSSRAGLEILEKNRQDVPEEIKEKFVKAHINPVPRIKEGRIILRAAKNPALMDASDGLADALSKICLFSNVAMHINFDDIPYDKDLSLVAVDKINIFKWVLFGGEDYELVGTVSEKVYKKLIDFGIFVKIIGTVVSADDAPYPYVKYKKKMIKIDSEIMKKEIFGHFADCEQRLGNPLFRLSIEKEGGGGGDEPSTEMPFNASNQDK